MAPTIGRIKEYSDVVAVHNRVKMVTGFGSKSGNGSAQISGLSAAVDAPVDAFFFGGTGANHGQITRASVSFIADRVQIENTSTTNTKVLIFWWAKR